MWQHIFAKIVLKVTGTEATTACKDYHICAGLKAGINGAVNGVHSIWDEKLTTEDWRFLILDVKNTFNDINRAGMLWTVRHLWKLLCTG